MNPVSAVSGFLPQVGPTELIIVLVIVVIIFGPKRIPAAAKSVGKGFRNFRDAVGGGDSGDGRKEVEGPDETVGPEPPRGDRAGGDEIHEKTKTGN